MSVADHRWGAGGDGQLYLRHVKPAEEQSATNGSWGEQYTFDNFGNLIGKMQTAGTAPAMSVAANLATNQLVRKL